MTEQNSRKKKNRLKDNTKVLLFRWWLAGAVYFFLAFGTSLGQNVSGIDLIFMLSVAIGFLTILIFNPVMYSMYDIKKHGKIMNDFYKHHSLFQGVIMKLIELLKCFVSVLLVSGFYYYVNIIITQIKDLPQETIILKGEPLLFATLFVIFYQLLSLIPNLQKGKTNE